MLVAVNIHIGFIYPFYSGIFGIADWSDAIVGLPHHALLRALETVSGAVLCTGTVAFFGVSFARFPESLWRLSLVPYCAAAVVFCLAGLRIPHGAELMITSVIPAALLGQSILVLVAPIARRFRSHTPSSEVIPASPLALLIALVLVVAILVTAPGLRFAAISWSG